MLYKSFSLNDQNFSAAKTKPFTDTDRYGRLIAEVYAGDQFTQAVLVSEGLAWSYRQFHQNCPSADLINQVEAEAKAAGVGVFSGGHVEPWEWRRR